MMLQTRRRGAELCPSLGRRPRRPPLGGARQASRATDAPGSFGGAIHHAALGFPVVASRLLSCPRAPEAAVLPGGAGCTLSQVCAHGHLFICLETMQLETHSFMLPL